MISYDDFEKLLRSPRRRGKTILIAYRVLVKGEWNTTVAWDNGVTRQRVHQIVQNAKSCLKKKGKLGVIEADNG